MNYQDILKTIATQVLSTHFGRYIVQSYIVSSKHSFRTFYNGSVRSG